MSPHANESRNEVSDEVSFLSLNAGGERQFLGSTSGVLLADLIRSAVEADSSSRGHLHVQGSRSAPVSELSAKTVRPLAASNEGPPPLQESVARDLHEAYFEHDHLCYPILCQQSAMANLSEIYAEPSTLERKPYETFVFYMIVAISTSNVQKLHWQSLPEAEIYQAQAISRLNDILALGGLEALQAILLLCQYRLTSSTQRTSASLWHMVGVAARMCFEMGLHREEAYKYRENHNTPLGTTLMIHRRCFWCVLAMDRVVSITLGRPFAIHLEDVDLTLPDCKIAQSTNPPERDEIIPTEEQHRTAVFVHITRYRILCGKIMASLHRSRHTTNESSALTVQAELANHLDEWRSKTCTLNLNSGASHGARSSSFLTLEWYEMIYYNALLMLYRPSPALPLSSSRATVVVPIIYVSAKQAISLYAHLHELQRINYTWVTLHSVFMAGLSFVYAAGQHFRSKKNQPQGQKSPMLESDPSILEIVNISRSCSNVLVAVSERGNIPRHCHRVFDRLSDAVLKDAVDYHTSHGAAASPQPVRPPPPPPPAPLCHSLSSNTSTSEYTMDMLTSGGWPFHDPGQSSLLAVDDAFRDCFDDLQHFHESAFGQDPIGQLSQDWLGQIGGMQLLGN
ncbi:hypothetical protein N7474_008790 [Penicillium riverlandense]|uniref:uncharacterized protein n=1 Tax=Penicillium riverlandense TaxID=1903569 RepID=UPI00254712D7|nr:uncharacterized protein N7474_008790 [Penicillium riverlandense]KAJ5812489.1 hypothetical protein N7474_008790 [Penicillium riverlandense]